jgi:ABC-type nitrate/sulfonate/bicarbonate transport system substrate-binding protein
MTYRRAVVIAAAAAGILGASLPRRAVAQANKLRMAGTNSDVLGEPLYAKDAGAFARAGFDLEVTSLANASAVAAAIGGGSLELGVGDLISGVNAINAGVPNVLVAGSGLYISTEPASILGAPKDSPIRRLSDLNGKAIGVPTLVGLTTAALRAWMPQNGVDAASVKLVELPAAAMVPAILRGTVACGLIGEPFITPNRKDLRDLGHPYDAIAKEFYVSVWYASKVWLDADRERARRAVNAIYETGRWANTHRPETLRILVRDAHFEADKLVGIIRSTYGTGPLTPAFVQPVLNVAAEYKIFDRVIDANTLITKL